MKTSRDRWSLSEAMRFAGVEWAGEPQIAFDADMTPQYRIRRASAHDGTMMFSVELMLKALMPLFDWSSYYKPMGPPPVGMRPKYTVGRILRFSAHGLVSLPAGRFPGERECVVIPVRCEYVRLAWSKT